MTTKGAGFDRIVNAGLAPAPRPAPVKVKMKRRSAKVESTTEPAEARPAPPPTRRLTLGEIVERLDIVIERGDQLEPGAALDPHRVRTIAQPVRIVSNRTTGAAPRPPASAPSRLPAAPVRVPQPPRPPIRRSQRSVAPAGGPARAIHERMLDRGDW